MSSVNKFIAVALLFMADSLFSQVDSCRYPDFRLAVKMSFEPGVEERRSNGDEGNDELTYVRSDMRVI